MNSVFFWRSFNLISIVSVDIFGLKEHIQDISLIKETIVFIWAYEYVTIFLVGNWRMRSSHLIWFSLIKNEARTRGEEEKVPVEIFSVTMSTPVTGDTHWTTGDAAVREGNTFFQFHSYLLYWIGEKFCSFHSTNINFIHCITSLTSRPKHWNRFG